MVSVLARHGLIRQKMPLHGAALPKVWAAREHDVFSLYPLVHHSEHFTNQKD